MNPSPIDPSGELRALASDCVHCGFCLPACPTYQLWGEEMDSPRGRIHLITQILDGSAASQAAATHLDRCLGCMACVPACPSGVRYDRLIEAARGWAEQPPSGAPAPVPPRSPRDRLARAAIFAAFPHPRRLRMLAAPLRIAQRAGATRLIERSPLAARLAPELVASLRVAPAPPRGHRPLTGRFPAGGPRRAVVGMLTGCVQQVFFPQVNEATVRLLTAEGCDVVIPPRLGCCGALSLHTGRAGEAIRLARRTIAAFEDAGVDVIVVNSAGCGSAMKEYGELFRAATAGLERPAAPEGTAGPRPADLAEVGGTDAEPPGGRQRRAAPAAAHPGPLPDGWPERAARTAAKVRDLTEYLAELAGAAGGPRGARHPLPVTVAYHDACHLGHAQRIRQQPRDLLQAIPGLQLAELGDEGTCCGSAGVYNLLQPAAAAELGARKAAAVLATGAPVLVSANPGCSLQIASAIAVAGNAAPPAILHIAEVLDASLRGLPVTALTGRPRPCAEPAVR